MADILQHRKGSTANNDLLTGALSEITHDMESQSLRVHDGTKQGGYEVGMPQAKGIIDLRSHMPTASAFRHLKYHTAEGDGWHGVFRAVIGAAVGAYVDNNRNIIVPTGGDGSLAWVMEDVSKNDRQIFGQEHLSSFRKKILTTSAAVMIFSGDSTTFGVFNNPDGTVGTLPVQYQIHTLVSDALLKKGVVGITATNAGHSGATMQQWNSTYLAQDIALLPALYVIRWGINDKSSGRTAEQVGADLRAGLTTLRAAHSDAVMSVLLMLPNAINDASTARDALWISQLRPHFKQAAADFKCAFIDTEYLLSDAVNATDYMDYTTLNPTKHIHPKEVLNTQIASYITDMIVPTCTSTIAKNAYIESNTTKLSTDLPATFPLGRSAFKAAGTGWGIGSADSIVTDSHRSGSVIQRAYSTILLNNRPVYAERRSINNSWSTWSTLAVSYSLLTGVASGTVPFRAVIRQNVLSLSGSLDLTSIASASQIATFLATTLSAIVWTVCRTSVLGLFCSVGVSQSGQLFFECTTTPFSGTVYFNMNINLT